MSNKDKNNIQARLYQSNSKSKSKSKHKYSFIQSQRQSIEKIQQITEEHYKKAMKHVHKFNHYEKLLEQRKHKEKFTIDQQCTFKPDLKKPKYKNNSQKGIISDNQYHAMKKTSNLHYFPSTCESLKANLNNQAVGQKINKSQKFPTSKINVNKTADRLIQWGITRDLKNINRTIQYQLSRSLSKESLEDIDKQQIMLKSQIINSKQKKNLNLTLSTILNSSQSKEKSIGQTPKSFTQKYYSMTQTPKESNQRVAFNALKTFDEYQTHIKRSFKKQRFATETNSIQRSIEKLKVTDQKQRGELNFYLRQAKANVQKNYNKKANLLIKNHKYSKNFQLINEKIK